MPNALFQATKPDEIEFNLTLTMSLGAWRKLSAQLESRAWPANDLSRSIQDMVRQAERHYYPTTEQE